MAVLAVFGWPDQKGQGRTCSGKGPAFQKVEAVGLEVGTGCCYQALDGPDDGNDGPRGVPADSDPAHPAPPDKGKATG